MSVKTVAMEVGTLQAGDESEGWIRWHPRVAEDPRNESLREAVESFEPPCNDAGEACAGWLKEHALEDWQYIATWVLYAQGLVHGFFALRSSSLNFTMEDGQKITVPCSQIEWLCKREGGKFHGRALIEHASGLALQVSQIQGNTLLIIEPYDERVAEILLERHKFFRSAEQGHLWLPLYHEVDLPHPG